jgi:carbon monoxide dehydrogenase subunit G
MEITGEQVIAAPREAVWKALNDPQVLKACLPGCESVEQTSPDEFKVVIKAVVGPLRARFQGLLRLTEAQPPASCVMHFEGQGGAVGFGKGSAQVTLRESPEGTVLSYQAKAQVGGKLAQVGSRLIDSVVRKMSDDFFTAFRRQLAPPQAQPEAPSPAGAQRSHDAGAAAAREPAATVSPVARALPAALPAALPHAHPQQFVVPGWWLAPAAILGAALAIAGALLIR